MVHSPTVHLALGALLSPCSMCDTGTRFCISHWVRRPEGVDEEMLLQFRERLSHTLLLSIIMQVGLHISPHLPASPRISPHLGPHADHLDLLHRAPSHTFAHLLTQIISTSYAMSYLPVSPHISDHLDLLRHVRVGRRLRRGGRPAGGLAAAVADVRHRASGSLQDVRSRRTRTVHCHAVHLLSVHC